MNDFLLVILSICILLNCLFIGGFGLYVLSKMSHQK